MIGATCFSGIGAPEVAMPHWQWLWHAELEKFPAAVMAARHKGSINLGDVTAEDFMQRATAFGQLDVLAGGPPCQAFSVAGLRKSMADDRGNLSLRFVRIAHAVRPRNLLVENVPGWLNTPDNAFGCFLGAILGHDDALHSPADGKWPRCGMASGPLGRLCWATLDAQFFGVAQRRRRVFVVVDFGNGADPAAVLFEPQGLLGHTPPSREAGERVAGTLTSRASGGGGGPGASTDGAAAEYLQPVDWPAEVAPTLTAAFGSKMGVDNQHVLGGGGLFVSDVLGMLTSRMCSALGSRDVEEGAIIPVSQNAAAQAHAFKVRGGCDGGGKGYLGSDELAFTLSTNDDQHIFQASDDVVCFEANMSLQTPTSGGAHPTLTRRTHAAVATQWSVRRLTPVECERLQGFPDDFTNIEYRGKPAADGPRYKALGNSWAVPVGRWILERIERFMPEPAA